MNGRVDWSQREEVLRRLAEHRSARLARTGRPELRLTQHELLSSARTAGKLEERDRKGHGR